MKKVSLLYRKKGIIEHAGVSLGDGRVLHIQPGGTAELVLYEEYANGEVVRAIPTEIGDPLMLRERAYRVLHSKELYNALTNNCEHVASYVLHGSKTSPQLKCALICAFVGGVMMQNSKTNNWLVGAGLAGVFGLLLHNYGNQKRK